MRQLALSFLFSCLSLFAWTQPTLLLDGINTQVDGNCEYTLGLQLRLLDRCIDAGDPLVQITVDAWNDGVIDYVASSDIRSRNWFMDPSRAAQEGLPQNTYWIQLDIEEVVDSMITYRSIYIPEDLGGLESDHTVNYRVIDACGDTVQQEKVYTVQDGKPPVAHIVSLFSTLLKDPDGPRGPLPSYVDLNARDFNVGSYDNCTDQEDLLFLIDGLLPVVDSMVELGDSMVHVDLTVPHYFDREGFVSLEPPALPTLCDPYDTRALERYIDFFEEGYFWDPSSRCSVKRFFDSPTVTHSEVQLAVADELLNISELASVSACCGPHPGTSCLGVAPLNDYGWQGLDIRLNQDCTIDYALDYDPTSFCPDHIDTVFAALVVVDPEVRDTLYYLSHEVPTTYDEWTIDNTLAGELGVPEGVWLKHMPLLIEGQAPEQLHELLSGIDGTGLTALGLGYRLTSSLGHTYVERWQHQLVEDSKPVIEVRQDHFVDADPSGGVEVSAKELVVSAEDNCGLSDHLIYYFADSPPYFLDAYYPSCQGLIAVDHLYLADAEAPLNDRPPHYLLTTEGIEGLPDSIQEAYRAGVWHRWSAMEQTAYRYLRMEDEGMQTIDAVVQDPSGNRDQGSTVVRQLRGEVPQDQEDLRVFPNPALDRLYVDLRGQDQQPIEARVLSVDGAFLYKQDLAIQDFSPYAVVDLSMLNYSGMTIVTFTYPNGSEVTRRVAVMR